MLTRTHTMINELKYRDVMISHIMPLLDNDDLVSLYNTSQIQRSFVLSFRNWELAYVRDFPHDKTFSGSFEQYIKRYNAGIIGLSYKPIRDLVASRFLMAALGIDGRVYIGPEWRVVPQLKAGKIWASPDHIFALDAGQLWMWKFLDAMPTRIYHQLGLDAATIIRSGVSYHAAYTPHDGVYWWKHTVGSSFEHARLGDYDSVVDMLVLKNGLLVLTGSGIDYWQRMITKRRIYVPASASLKSLEVVDFHCDLFAAITHTNERILFNINELRSINTRSIVRNAILQLAMFAVAAIPRATSISGHSGATSQALLRHVSTADSIAELVLGDFECPPQSFSA